jgi:hypothetical protein
MKNICLFILTAILIYSCNNNVDTNIDNIEILYYNGVFERIENVDCDEIIYNPAKQPKQKYTEDGEPVPMEVCIIKATINNKQVLQEIESELEKLELFDGKNNIDARMKCFIKYKNNSIDTLCVGDNPQWAVLNNIQSVRLSNKLIYLLRKNCGFYKWVGYDYMQYFDEMNDTTFVREDE